MEVTKTLIEKYVSGHCTEEERRAVEAWLPGNEDIASALSDDFLVSEQDEMWKKISGGVSEFEHKESISFYKPLLKYVAAVTLLIGISGLLFFLNNRTPSLSSSSEEQQPEIVLCSRSSYKIKLNLDASFTARKKPIKITNVALVPKCIVMGKYNSVRFVIKPHQTYYLGGSFEKPSLTKA